MNDNSVATTEDEKKLQVCVEQLTSGKVIAMERQVRWRPAWFVDVELDGKIIYVHIRGDRQSDVLPFTELRREADILQILEKHGIPVPHIYGMCADPEAIIMETVPGTRDVATASNDEERISVARQYIDAIAAMHQLPLEDFAEKGIHIPQGAEEIALVGLNAYMPLYNKHKSRPEPFLEFSIRWLRSNIPSHRTKPSFIAFDAGQFLFEEGKVTALYDFEFAMVGDALTDLATMAMRQSVEHMGDEIGNLCHYYAEVTGEPIDIKTIRYHHALFSTTACMQFVGAIANPQPGDPHDVYTDWNLALRRSLLNVLAENLDISLEAPASIAEKTSSNSALFTMLNDAVSQISTDNDVQKASKSAALNLVEYMAKVDECGAELERLTADDAEKILGVRYDDPQILAQKLEEFVSTAGPEYNQALLQLFSNQIERQVQVYSDTTIGQSAVHVRLEPID